MTDTKPLPTVVREKLGSRSARKLRADGQLPCSLQADSDHEHVNLAISEYDFLSARRHHVHLYDLDINGNLESAVVRELQWDALGSRVNHVEFKRVTRGVATESEVELEFIGHPKNGQLNHLHTHITISCIPSLIPDAIEVKVGHMELGDHLKAADLEMPEGISIAIDPETEIVVVSAEKVVVEETDDEDGLDGEAPMSAPVDEPPPAS